MIWQPLGDVLFANTQIPWAHSHLMGPTPIQISEDVIRVYVTCLDEFGIGRPTYVDVSSSKPTNVIAVNAAPILDVGAPGTFDDNGIMATSVLQVSPGTYYMYYAGFEICSKIRYRIFTGLAISTDNGKSFNKMSAVPILDRSDEEKFFRGGPNVLFENGKFKLWYVGGGSWTVIDGKEMPVYELKYAESDDGIVWPKNGKTIMPITKVDEHGFGRPWVTFSQSHGYQMFYSIRNRPLMAYRLGFATSSDGIVWDRKDSQVGLAVAPGTLSTTSIEYLATISIRDKTYCFYNGDNFGEYGFSVSELIE